MVKIWIMTVYSLTVLNRNMLKSQPKAFLYNISFETSKANTLFSKIFDIMSYKQKISYLDQIRPWQKTWLIQAKVVHT